MILDLSSESPVRGCYEGLQRAWMLWRKWAGCAKRCSCSCSSVSWPQWAGVRAAFFRKSADNEVNDILAEKNQNLPWKIENYHVYPDPRSRAADPTNPDRPPMPADDAATYLTTPHPQGPGLAGVGNVYGTAYMKMIDVWDTENRAGREDASLGEPGQRRE